MTSTVADERLLLGAPATITGRFRDQHGELAAPSGTVTVAVTDGAGAEVYAAGTATDAGSTGVYSLDISAADTASLDVLTAVWTADGDDQTVTTRHAVVGGYYASVAELRAADEVYADTAKYPDAALRDARALVEDEFESVTGRAFVPRFRIDVRELDRLTPRLNLAEPVRAIRWATLSDGDGSSTDLDVSAVEVTQASVAHRPAGWPAGTITIGYEYGYGRPPADVLGAFLLRLRDVANRNRRGIPDRTSTFTATDSGGTFSLVVPGQRGSITAIGDVDVVLRRYTGPGIA